MEWLEEGNQVDNWLIQVYCLETGKCPLQWLCLVVCGSQVVESVKFRAVERLIF